MSRVRNGRTARHGLAAPLGALLAAGCGPKVHDIEPDLLLVAEDSDAPAQAPAPSELRSEILQISGNHLATCSIDDRQALRCWGPLPGSLIGTEGATGLATPQLIDTAQYVDSSVGAFHLCAVRKDGSVWCRGRNCAGQLGDAAIDDTTALVRVPLPLAQSHVAVGGGHTCTIDAAFALTCWGGADYGQRECSQVTKEPPTAVPGTWLQVSANYYGVYALDLEGGLHRLLHGERPNDPLFQMIPEKVGDSRWRSIAAGVAFACGVRDDGSLACARDDRGHESQLGSDLDWQGVVAADYRVCALKNDGTIWCTDNALFEHDDAPLTQMGHVREWTGLSVGIDHVCGLRDGRVTCWGSNDYGQLGMGELE